MHVRMHERLIVWQEAYALCLWIHFQTKKFPPEERYRLTEQMCKASSSVPINIAEGNARRTPKDKRKFFNIAIASLEEVHVELMLARDLGYIDPETFDEGNAKINRISIMLWKLYDSIR